VVVEVEVRINFVKVLEAVAEQVPTELQRDLL